MIEADSIVRDKANAFINEGCNKRGILALQLMLNNSHVSTDDLKEAGYDHPPRAIGDIRDAGIPIITERKKSPISGKSIAYYRLGRSEDIQNGLFNGRTIFPKAFRDVLVRIYSSRDCITGAVLKPGTLQIDHRVPYRIAGNLTALVDLHPNNYMLLSAETQRRKSNSCENCPNVNPTVCGTCYWASPENYTHIATTQNRRADIIWNGSETKDYDSLKKHATDSGITLSDLVKKLTRKRCRSKSPDLRQLQFELTHKSELTDLADHTMENGFTTVL